MTADEIRKLHGQYVDEMTADKAEGEPDHGYVHHAQLHMLTEIAAQLAELNTRLFIMNEVMTKYVEAYTPPYKP